MCTPTTDIKTPGPAGFLRKWGPVLLPALILPGGLLIALYVWFRRSESRCA